MKTLINNGRVVPDNWRVLAVGVEDHPGPVALPETGDWIVPFSVWQAHKAQFQWRRGRNGVLIENADEASALSVTDFDKLALIAVRFRNAADPEPRTIAMRLREVSGWKGALRATGDIRQDLIPELRRFGFDSFELTDLADAPESPLPAGGSRAVDDDAENAVPFFRPHFVRMPNGRELS